MQHASKTPRPYPYPYPLPKAVILDMDGLLLDTEKISRACYRLALEAFAVAGEVDVDAHYAQLIGLPAPRQRQVLGGILPDSIDVAEFDGYWRAVFRQCLTGEEGQPAVGGGGVARQPAKVGVKEGGEGLCGWLAGQGVGLAVATSTHTDLAQRLLGRAGLLAEKTTNNDKGMITSPAEKTTSKGGGEVASDGGGWIGRGMVVGGDQVRRGKPSPDLYLRAARMVGVKAGECLAFEDSGPGVASAAAAGMKVVCVPDVVKVDEETRKRAMVVAGSLTEAREKLGWI